MLLITGISFANHWYNTNSVDLKILVTGGIATGILALVNAIPGASPLATGIAWLAFIGVTIAPVQSPTPLENLGKIAGVKLLWTTLPRSFWPLSA
jgi:hypothetical protein